MASQAEVRPAVGVQEFATVIEHCLEQGLVSRALELFEQAKGLDVPLDLPCCHRLLGALGSECNVGDIQSVLDYLRKQGICATSETYDRAIEAAVRVDDFLYAFKLVQVRSAESRPRGLTPPPMFVLRCAHLPDHVLIHFSAQMSEDASLELAPETWCLLWKSTKRGLRLGKYQGAEEGLIKDIFYKAASRLQVLVDDVIQFYSQASRAVGDHGRQVPPVGAQDLHEGEEQDDDIDNVDERGEVRVCVRLYGSLCARVSGCRGLCCMGTGEL
jgi:hypothetical protein